VGQPYRYPVEAWDPDPDDVLTYRLDEKPDGMAIDAVTGVIEWTPAAGEVGEHRVTLRVSDRDGAEDAQTFTVDVQIVPNRPPVITTEPVTTHVIRRQCFHREDFESGVSDAWSPRRADTTPVGGRHFYGQFNNETARLTLTNLPPHSRLKVTHDLFLIRTWDGNGAGACPGPDIWGVRVDGAQVMNTTFRTSTTAPEGCPGLTQSYPDDYFSANPIGVGASERNSLGYTWQGHPSDAVYRIEFATVHDSSEVSIEFYGAGLQSPPDESWGLDNVCVTLETNVVAGWDRSRGGELSFVEGGEFEKARESLSTHFPSARLKALSALTPSGLSDVDLLFLQAPAAVFDEDITALTPVEQSELVRFVERGGCAVILADTPVSSSVANASLVGPFGMAVGQASRSGELAQAVGGGGPLLSGPWGNLTQFRQLDAGYIQELGPLAQSLAANSTGTALALVEPGRFGPGAGALIVLSDTNTFMDDPGPGGNTQFFSESEPLFLNVVDYCLSRTSGSPASTLKPETWLLKSRFTVAPESNQVMTAPVILDLDGDGAPEIVFASFAGRAYQDGILRVITGRDVCVRDTNLSLSASAVPVVSSTYSDSWPSFRAIDGDPSTSWFTERPAQTSDFYELRFARPVSVTSLEMLGNRESADGFDVHSGVFQLLDGSGAVLWDSGNVELPAPTRDMHLTIGRVDGVRRVRFQITASDPLDAGFSELRVMGDGCLPGAEVWSVTDPNLRVDAGAAIAAGDIDADGRPEIVSRDPAGHVVVFEHDGAFKWRSTEIVPAGDFRGGGAALADVDRDGQVEVVAGNVILDGNGELRARGPAGRSGRGISTVADLDGDGTLEIVLGGSALRSDGSVYWTTNAVPDSLSAVANFDEDPLPEVVAVGSGKVFLLEPTGEVIWGPVAIPGGGRGGAPTIGNFDADPAPEIGVAGRTKYVALDDDGSILWTADIDDTSSNATGSSVFDFNGDGLTEVVYGDQVTLHGYDGASGALVFEIDKPSGTDTELPVVADVDADGRADVVAAANQWFGGLVRGLIVASDAEREWAATRPVWNQHSYHITNVGDDGTIPRQEEPNWLTQGLNTFRTNRAIAAAITGGYRYDADAFDPDGDSLRFRLAAGPPGMQIDPITGLVSWNPGTTQVGTHDVTIVVDDGRGGTDEQHYQLSVTTDLDGDNFTAEQGDCDDNAGTVYPNAPEIPSNGIDEDCDGADVLGPIDIDDDGDGYTEREGDCDDTDAAIRPGAVDIPGNGIDEDCSGEDSVPPPGTILVAPASIAIISDQAHQFTATGRFADGSTRDLTDLVTWETSGPDVASIDTHGVAFGLGEGSTAITATLTGVSGSANLTVIARAVDDTTPPTALIKGPPNDTAIGRPTDIIGTADDANLLRYVLEIRDENEAEDTFRLLATGTSPVRDGVLATLDPTMLPNSVYRLRLTVHDRGGNSNTAQARYSVVGDLKLGNFRVSFTDLTIPVAGIPISITRTYDSLDTSPGDFGAGWRLGYPGQVVDSALEPSEAFTDLTRVYVTKPDGRRVGFSFVVTCGLFCSGHFRPDPGVTDSLTVPQTTLFHSGGQYFEFDKPYNPRTYVLTTKEKVEYTIDEIDGLKSIKDANGNTLTVTADGLEHSSGVGVTFERDGAGRITKITEPADAEDPAPPAFLRYTYEQGNLREFADQLGHTTTYGYENAQFPHYLTKIVDPVGRQTVRTVYDDEGRLIASCDANGDPSTLDGCVRLTSEPGALLQTIVNARGFRSDLLLDARGNVQRERRWFCENPECPDDPGCCGGGLRALDTIRTYDAANNLLSETDPEGNVKFYSYDARGNQLTKTEGGRTTIATYNACNKIETETDPANNVTATSYDATGCLARFVTNALGDATEYRYNAAGQVTDMIDANRNGRHWDYDGAGFLRQMTDPLGKSATYGFSPAGDLRFQVDRKGQRIDFTYDDAHRLRTETWDTVPPRVTTYGYNVAGQLASAVDPDSSLALGYDALGRLETVDNSGTPGAPQVVVRYGYDASGNVEVVSDSLGGLTAYSHDGLDRLIRITQSGTGVNPKRVDLAYDGASLLRELRRFSDLAGTQGVANTSYGYDCGGCAGRLTSVHHRKASDGSTIHDLDFVRDVLGDIRQMTDAEGVHTYTYDLTRQLKTATHPTAGPQPNERYEYDGVGNRLTSHLSSSHIYQPSSNRLVQDDQFNYQYDENGSLILRTNRATGELMEVTYDHRSRTRAIEQRTAGGSLLERSTYVYDAANRRISSDEGGGRGHVLYDGRNPILALGALGQVSDRRLYTRRLDGLVATEEGRFTRWVTTDQVGSVRDQLMDAGEVSAHELYESFGSSVGSSNAPMFQGHDVAFGTDLYHVRARDYLSGIGRFVSADPQPPYGYSFAQNNPLSFTDPTGETVTLEQSVVVGLITNRAILALCVLGAKQRKDSGKPSGGKFIVCAGFAEAGLIASSVGGLPGVLLSSGLAIAGNAFSELND
jgi:RHS repeat-associated protein